MRFIEAEIEERPVRTYKKLKAELKRFISMNIKSARVIYTEAEYSCSTSARKALSEAAKMHSLPIKALMRNGNVYLIRTDL